MSAPQQGWIAPGLQREFPELRLHWVQLPARQRRSPPEIKRRLRDLADSVSGSRAVMVRRQAVPHAYRTFFRHVGLDPDRDRPPHEELIVQRLRHGGFRSHGLIPDALTIAIMETGVPVWAMDAAEVQGDIGVRAAGKGEEVAGLPVPEGRLVVADAVRLLAVLFGELQAPVTRATREVVLFSVRAPHVPGIHVEEALWMASSIIGEPS